MLRHAALCSGRRALVVVSAPRRSASSVRRFTSSSDGGSRADFTTKASKAHKRALSKKQLAGEKEVAAAPAPAAKKKATAPGVAKASAPASSAVGGGGAGGAKSASEGSGGGGGIIAIAGLGAACAGAAYYFEVNITDELNKLMGSGEKELVVSKETPVLEEKKKEVEEEKPEGKPAPEPVAQEAVSEGKVTAVPAVPIDEENRPPQEVPKLEQPVDGSRVSVEKIGEFFAKAAADAAEEAKEAEEAAGAEVIEIEPIVEKEAEVVSHAVVSAEAAAAELKAEAESATDGALRSAHRSLRANVDEAYLSDLEKLGIGELKVRLVQLAAEMEERTKWEAVRLKEFLALKEKETADKYLEVLQKQRLEFEDLLARRLREQEDGLTRQANAALQAKEDAIQSVVSAATEAQQVEHGAELQSASERIDRELRAKYEAEVGKGLADAKAAFARETEEKLSVVERLSEKLRALEGALEVSRSFESGSQKAHRLSAAALALAGKMEAGKGAAEELAALKMAAGDEGVIGSAVSKLPSSVKGGVPTLSELQSTFEVVYSASRQAALVPKGRSGLGAQIMGMTFATLTIPPAPDAPSTATTGASAEDAGSSGDYILSRARRHVQLGELARAVEELDKLDGQSAFAVKDWKSAASDRIAVERALSVMKMECAVLNQSMSGS
eukprot:CAMPEP_0113599574 /NCGR_PEP_ID=MMETSP0015_2-20120614/42223_1 /TAXON_ID=2838 /ORGANISM="Odontella" /LENGTH=670 /DNA_ID=CAMNT_0000507727 /DNA_START=24 /DNA_END=2036 /DNA_ORIENTATION=+ /assembly_acc=CAM_ASM_000160